MLKDAQISVLRMVVGGDAVMKDAIVLLEVNPDCAFGTVVAKDARKKTAQRAQKVSPVCAYHMGVAVDASIWHATKVLKVARCFARHMEVAKGARLKGAPRVQKGAHLFARATVEGKGVHSRVVGFARRACMGGHYSVWHTGVERGVPCQSAQRVHGVGLIFVSVMVGARDANLKGVGRVHRAALIFARHMEEVRDVSGDSPGQSSGLVMDHVTHFLGGRLGYVRHMALWFRTNGYMGVPPW